MCVFQIFQKLYSWYQTAQSVTNACTFKVHFRETYGSDTSQLNNRITKKSVSYVQSQQYKHQNQVKDVVLMFLLLTLNIFYLFLESPLLTLNN